MGIGAELAASGFGVSGAIGAEVSASITYDKNPDGSADIAIGGELSIYGYIKAWGIAGVGCEGTVSLTYFLSTEILRAHGEVVGWVTVLWVDKEWIVEVTEDFDMGNNGTRMASAARDRARLAASPDPGSFGDVYSNPAWSTYCGAFA
jgi:hypothetical protein